MCTSRVSAHDHPRTVKLWWVAQHDSGEVCPECMLTATCGRLGPPMNLPEISLVREGAGGGRSCNSFVREWATADRVQGWAMSTSPRHSPRSSFQKLLDLSLGELFELSFMARSAESDCGPGNRSSRRADDQSGETGRSRVWAVTCAVKFHVFHASQRLHVCGRS